MADTIELTITKNHVVYVDKNGTLDVWRMHRAPSSSDIRREAAHNDIFAIVKSGDRWEVFDLRLMTNMMGQAVLPQPSIAAKSLDAAIAYANMKG